MQTHVVEQDLHKSGLGVGLIQDLDADGGVCTERIDHSIGLHTGEVGGVAEVLLGIDESLPIGS